MSNDFKSPKPSARALQAAQSLAASSWLAADTEAAIKQVAEQIDREAGVKAMVWRIEELENLVRALRQRL